MENFWDFNVWSGFNIFAILLISLLVANIMKRRIPGLQESLIPTSVLGGGVLIEGFDERAAFCDAYNAPVTMQL